MEERVDHDTLIRLEEQVASMAKAMEEHNMASVARDTRIETKVDRINGTVQKNVGLIAELERRPKLPEWLTAEAVTRGVAEHQDVLRDWPEVREHVESLWDAYRFGRWLFAAAVGLLVLVQPLEIVLIQHFL